MARLIVFRGETPAQEVDLARLPLTIGRGSTNDVVLDDPVKSVSREHAEIRLEGGRFVLADRQSENGIWLAGRRLPAIPFDADTVASLGPFRLKIDGLPPSVPDSAAASAAPASAAPAAAPAAKAPVRRRVALVTATVAASVAALLHRLTPQQQRVAAAAVALVAVATLGIAGVVRSARERDRAAGEITAMIAAAHVQLGQGACADALAVNISPALMRDPANGELLGLKQRAEACLAPLPPIEPPPPSAVEIALTSARDALAQGQCDDALLQQIVAVLTTEPENVDALALKAEIEKCAIKPVRPGVAAAKPLLLAQRIRPEDGGLEPLTGELDGDYQNRMRSMRQRYEEAVAAASRTVGRSVIEALEAIAREATPQYLSISATLAAARQAYAETAQRVLAEARELAKNSRWNESLQKYTEARDIDPSVPIEGEVSKLQDDKRQEGLRACRSARQNANYNEANARAEYKRVLELLGPSEECYAIAQKALAPK